MHYQSKPFLLFATRWIHQLYSRSTNVVSKYSHIALMSVFRANVMRIRNSYVDSVGSKFAIGAKSVFWKWRLIMFLGHKRIKMEWEAKLVIASSNILIYTTLLLKRHHYRHNFECSKPNISSQVDYRLYKLYCIIYTVYYLYSIETQYKSFTKNIMNDPRWFNAFALDRWLAISRNQFSFFSSSVWTITRQTIRWNWISIWHRIITITWWYSRTLGFPSVTKW